MTDREQGQIDRCIRASLDDYFEDLGTIEPGGLYDMVLRAVEKPLLEVVMKRTDGNQSRAAEWLGLNRTTLRKKLVDHRLLGK